MKLCQILLPLLLLTLLTGCGSQEKSTEADKTGGTSRQSPLEPATASGQPDDKPLPPAPPLSETFDAAPQLSLFPRVSAFRPEDDDKEGLSYWGTFIDHLLRTSGVAEKSGRDGSRSWAIRSLKGVDSIAFFSPLEVKPQTTYRVSFALKGELPEAASAGIGILEFDEFLWLGEQYPESLLRQHQTGALEGVRLQGKQQWQEHSFTFTTSPKTRMIHLVLFREGAEDRKHPVLFDDIRIAEADAD